MAAVVLAAGAPRRSTRKSRRSRSPPPLALVDLILTNEHVIRGADKVEVGDVVVSLAGQPVETPEDLLVVRRGHAPDENVAVELSRGGRQQDVKVRPVDRPVG
ncbi:hypothetical protein [Arthrobacter sp. USHLN218]|uniref:hypothetical protein n=1 Tax=Arthrobacter sp. USHLN218 TaxID=3081232 RepID=UPI00301856F9